MRIFIIALALFMTIGCTQNDRAKNWGGQMKVELPCGERLYDVTWKGDSFWYATRPLLKDETPRTYIFREDSSFGVLQGKVKIVECRRGRRVPARIDLTK